MRVLFTATTFLNAALLFLVQPMVAKMILPRFGGAPAVWVVSMLFFQAALLVGYGYAHGATRKVPARVQAWTHLAILVVAGALTLPLALPSGWTPAGDADPTLPLLGLMALVVGPSFVVLSGGSPMLQRWYATSGAPDADNPYFLYGAGNVGSLLALLAYPFVLEPRWALPDQARLWAGLFALLCVLMGLCAASVKQKTTSDEPALAPTHPPSRATRARWVVLAAVPSSLLLGVTTYLTSNLTPMPLLWVVPLALYLATFAAAFARRPLLGSTALARVLPLLATPLALALVLEATEPLGVLAGLHLAAFVVAAWMCHARLVETKPSVDHLTEFYFWIALGGVTGGLVNALLAPQLFSTLIEYPLALAAACLLRPSRDPQKRTALDFAWPVAVAALMTAVSLAGLEPGPWRTLAAIGAPAILCFLAVDRPLRFGLSLAALFVAAQTLNIAAGAEVLAKRRSFFGVHRVLASDRAAGRFTQLLHGNTIHGMQNARVPELPLTYYHPTGPAGQIFQKVAAPGTKIDIALVGLGVGALAAYGQPGQRDVYFEIDPEVERIARNPQWFTFLRDSKADVQVVLGDARLTLARADAGRFGLIVLDAFSSDAIPMHLLTLEALEMARTKLAPGGLILIHISNRYVDLQPVLGGAAVRLGWAGWVQEDTFVDEQDALEGKEASTWAVLAPDPDSFAPVRHTGAWIPLPKTPDRAWTDAFSNLLGALRKPDDF